MGLRRLACVGTLVAGLAAAGCRQPPPAMSGRQLPAAADLALGPGDVFDVRVFGEPELSGTYRVSTDCRIDYPLIGQVQVGARSPTEVAHEIASRLAAGYLRSPQVSIFVKEYASKKVSVFGQVQRPGTFNFVENMTVVEAVSLAGGFTPLAAKDDTWLTRVAQGQMQKIRVPVKAIAEGGAPNVFLRPGDIVFIPERLF